VAEALQRLELEPLRRLGVLHLQLDDVLRQLGAAADHHHYAPAEQGGVLLPAERRFIGVLLGRLDPVPLSVPVSAQAPGVVQCHGVRSAASENDHHAERTAAHADSCTMLDSLAGPVVRTVKSGPGEGSSLYVETPNVRDGFTACVAAEDQQVGFAVDDYVAVPAAGSAAYDGHDHPRGLVVPIAHVQQLEVVRSQRPAPGRPALDHHLKQL